MEVVLVPEIVNSAGFFSCNGGGEGWLPSMRLEYETLCGREMWCRLIV